MSATTSPDPTAGIVDRSLLNGIPDYSDVWDQEIRRTAQENIRSLSPQKLVLPSGKPVVAIRPNVYQLLEAGLLPDTVLAKVYDFLEVLGAVEPQTEGETKSDAQARYLVANLSSFLEIANPLVCMICVSPRFTTDSRRQRTKGVYHVRHMTVEDRLFLYNWMNGVSVEAMSSFRDGDDQEAESDLGGVRQDEVERSAPVDPPGPPARKPRRVRRRPNDLEDRPSPGAEAPGDGQGSDHGEEKPTTLQDQASVHVPRGDRGEASEAVERAAGPAGNRGPRGRGAGRSSRR